MPLNRYRPSAVLAALVLTSSVRATGPETVRLDFLNAPEAGAPLVDVPRLAVGVGVGVGKAALRPAVVDTGSTSVVLSASAMPDLDRLPSLGPGTITYSSSGRIMRGRWVETPLVIAGQTGRIVTRPMPVLAVEEIACTPAARRCTPERYPGHVAMLGIGFGRQHDGQPNATPDRNPLLDIATPAALPRSYVVTRRGLSLGSTQAGFTLVKLARDAAGTDWSAPPACIALNAGQPACGTALVDTGIVGMFLAVPPDRLPAGGARLEIAPGTRISVDLAPMLPRAGLRFTIRAGDRADPAAPSAITLAGIGRRPSFINTGAHLLNRFDYLYDADAGAVGYRPTERQAQDSLM